MKSRSRSGSGNSTVRPIPHRLPDSAAPAASSLSRRAGCPSDRPTPRHCSVARRPDSPRIDPNHSPRLVAGIVVANTPVTMRLFTTLTTSATGRCLRTISSCASRLSAATRFAMCRLHCRLRNHCASERHDYCEPRPVRTRRCQPSKAARRAKIRPEIYRSQTGRDLSSISLTAQWIVSLFVGQFNEVISDFI